MIKWIKKLYNEFDCNQYETKIFLLTTFFSYFFMGVNCTIAGLINGKEVRFLWIFGLVLAIGTPGALFEVKKDIRTLSYAIFSAIAGSALSILVSLCLQSIFWFLLYIVEFCIYLLLVLFDYFRRYRKKH